MTDTYLNDIGLLEDEFADFDVGVLQFLDDHRSVGSGALDHGSIEVVRACAGGLKLRNFMSYLPTCIEFVSTFLLERRDLDEIMELR